MSQPQPYMPAILPSAGLQYKQTTLHVFDRLQTRVGSDDVAIVYKCTETGVERVWGLE